MPLWEFSLMRSEMPAPRAPMLLMKSRQWTPASVRGFFRVVGRCSVRVMRTSGGVIFIELLGALRALEFMALAGNGKQRNGHKQDGEKFHHAA